MHLTQAIIILLSALSISGIAAYVSVTGMMAVFPAEPIIVAVIMSSLEFGKVAAVEWLHSNWRNTLVSSFHKAYMCLAVVALMLVTAIGIYGFFSKGYLAQHLPAKEAQIQITEIQNRIADREKELTYLDTRLSQLDSTVDRALSGRSDLSANRASSLRNQQKSERSDIANERTKINSEVKALREELIPLQRTNMDVEAKLGPVKYFSSLFGLADEQSAVQIIIMVLMFAFDPFAICLVISASISFKTWVMIKSDKVKIREVQITPAVVETSQKQESQVTDPEPPADAELEEQVTVQEHQEPSDVEAVEGPQPTPEMQEVQVIETNTPDVVVAGKPTKLKKTKRKKNEDTPLTIDQVASSYMTEYDLDKVMK